MSVAAFTSMGEIIEGTVVLLYDDRTVEQASMDSFPCSDPPAYGPVSGLGPPEHRTEAEDPAARPRRRSVRLGDIALVQGLVFLGAGLWPVLHLRSFQRVTGPKTDGWLVRTVGLLLAGIGATLLFDRRRNGTTSPSVSFLGASTALSLAAVDLVGVATRRLSPVYLLDAAMEAGFLAGWWSVAKKRDLERAPRSSVA